MRDAILCPTCPLCGELPNLVFSPIQVFCGNPECSAASWNMTITAQANRKHRNLINIEGLELPVQVDEQ